jgi:hypothetical protein
MGEEGSACEILVAKPEGKRQFLSLRRRRLDAIEIDIKAVWW